MSLVAGTDTRLRARKAFHAGKVRDHGLVAMLQALKDAESADGGAPADPKLFLNASALTSTDETVKSSASTVFGVRALSPSGASNDVIVQLRDNNIVKASVLLGATEAAEAYFFGGSGSVGIDFATNVTVRVVAVADGSSNPAAGDRPAAGKVEVLYA